MLERLSHRLDRCLARQLFGGLCPSKCVFTESGKACWDEWQVVWTPRHKECWPPQGKHPIEGVHSPRNSCPAQRDSARTGACAAFAVRRPLAERQPVHLGPLAPPGVSNDSGDPGNMVGVTDRIPAPTADGEPVSSPRRGADREEKESVREGQSPSIGRSCLPIDPHTTSEHAGGASAPSRRDGPVTDRPHQGRLPG